MERATIPSFRYSMVEAKKLKLNVTEILRRAAAFQDSSSGDDNFP
jgi:hypothetical protein